MKNRQLYFFLRICTSFIFLAKGIHGFLLDYPFRVFLWDERLLSPFITKLGITWESYVNSTLMENSLEKIRVLLAVFFCILSILIWIVPKKIYKIPLWAGILVLLILALLHTKDVFWNLAILMEHGVQIGVPLIFILSKEENFRNYLIGLKIALALTFIGHSFFAIGIFPIPGDYIQMTINILHIEEVQAISFLKVIGILDLIASILLFVKIKPLYQVSLVYLILWGFLTALARIVGHYHTELGISSIKEYWHETLLRLPHGLLPFGIFFFQTKNEKLNHFETKEK